MAGEQERPEELSLGELIVAQIGAAQYTLADIAAERRDIDAAFEETQFTARDFIGSMVMNHEGDFISLLEAENPQELLDAADIAASNMVDKAKLEEYSTKYVQEQTEELMRLLAGKIVTARSTNGIGFVRAVANNSGGHSDDPLETTGVVYEIDLENAKLSIAPLAEDWFREVTLFGYDSTDETQERGRVVQQASLEIVA